MKLPTRQARRLRATLSAYLPGLTPHGDTAYAPAYTGNHPEQPSQRLQLHAQCSPSVAFSTLIINSRCRASSGRGRWRHHLLQGGTCKCSVHRAYPYTCVSGNPQSCQRTTLIKQLHSRNTVRKYYELQSPHLFQHFGSQLHWRI